MLSSLLAPIFGSFTQSAFAQNVGLVAVHRTSRAAMSCNRRPVSRPLGLLPSWPHRRAVPSSVLGGAASCSSARRCSGIRTLSKVDYANNMNLVIVATSIGFGMIPIASPTFYEHFPAWVETIFHSGISSAALMAIGLNLIFNHMTAGNSDQQSVFVAGRSGRSATRTSRDCTTATISSTASSTTPTARKCACLPRKRIDGRQAVPLNAIRAHVRIACDTPDYPRKSESVFTSCTLAACSRGAKNSPPRWRTERKWRRWRRNHERRIQHTSRGRAPAIGRLATLGIQHVLVM